MSIDNRIINHLERLARIELTPAEKRRLVVQLDRIVGYVKQLQQVDTGTAEPSRAGSTSQSTPTTLRPDEPEPCIDRGPILDEAPDTEKGLLRVPRVIDR